MFDEAEIYKLFKELGLENEKDRAKILSQGLIVLQKEEQTKVLRLESDSITNEEHVGGE